MAEGYLIYFKYEERFLFALKDKLPLDLRHFPLKLRKTQIPEQKNFTKSRKFDDNKKTEKNPSAGVSSPLKYSEFESLC